MADVDDDRIVAEGEWGTVEYAVRSDDSMPAKGFIEDLDEEDQRKLANQFDRMAQEGKIRNREKFRKVDGKIFEFKCFQVRVGCFQEGRTWFLTHGFIKKSDKWKNAELDRANAIRDEHLA